MIEREVARFVGSRVVINLATPAAGGRWIEVREIAARIDKTSPKSSIVPGGTNTPPGAIASF